MGPGQVLLRGVRWATYAALVDEVENRGIRLTYDRGELEIATSTFEREVHKKRIGRMVDALTEVLGIAMSSGGSTTLNDAQLAKGLEPDACYWVQNEPLVRGRIALDLRKDPPPDLAIEVEVSRSALDRLGIYASLGVGEVWRWTGTGIVCHIQGATGDFAEASTSRCFPFLVPNELTRFLEDEATGETAWIRGFRKWVRNDLGRRAGVPPLSGD